MAIVRYSGVSPVVASTILIYNGGTQVPATIYADDLSTPKGNPFTSDALTGLYTYWAEFAVYDEVIVNAGQPTPPSPSTPGTVTNIGALTADQIILGAGGSTIAPLGTLGLATQVLHGNPSGPPLWTAVVNADFDPMPASTVKANLTLSTAVPTDATFADLSTAMGLLIAPTIAQGDLLYGSGVDAIAVLPKDAVGVKVLSNQGASNNPSWIAVPASAPTAHATTHQNGGSDEISVAGLSGLLADGQTPTAHETTHRSGGSDPLSVLNLAGFSASTTEFLRKDGTFAVPAGGAAAGWVLLETQTASASASITLTAFSSTYNNYVVVFTGVVLATDAANLLLTAGDAGGLFSANYQYVNAFRGTTVAAGTNVSASAANWAVFNNADNVLPIAGTAYLLNTQQTSGQVSITAAYTGFASTGEFFKEELAGVHALTAAITQLRFAASSGNLTAGTFKLYGISQ